MCPHGHGRNVPETMVEGGRVGENGPACPGCIDCWLALGGAPKAAKPSSSCGSGICCAETPDGFICCCEIAPGWACRAACAVTVAPEAVAFFFLLERNTILKSKTTRRSSTR